MWGGGCAPRSARADCAAAPARARAPCPSRERSASRAPPAAHRRCMCMRACMPMARASHVCRVRMAHLSHHRRTCRSCVRESPYLAASSASRSSHPHSTRGCPASKPASCFSGSRRCFCSPAMAARVSATLSSSSDGRATTARLSCATLSPCDSSNTSCASTRDAPAPSTSGAPRTTLRSVFSLSCSRACSCERRGSTSSANRIESRLGHAMMMLTSSASSRDRRSCSATMSTRRSSSSAALSRKSDGLRRTTCKPAGSDCNTPAAALVNAERGFGEFVIPQRKGRTRCALCCTCKLHPRQLASMAALLVRGGRELVRRRESPRVILGTGGEIARTKLK